MGRSGSRLVGTNPVTVQKGSRGACWHVNALALRHFKAPRRRRYGTSEILETFAPAFLHAACEGDPAPLRRRDRMPGVCRPPRGLPSRPQTESTRR